MRVIFFAHFFSSFSAETLRGRCWLFGLYLSRCCCCCIFFDLFPFFVLFYCSQCVREFTLYIPLLRGPRFTFIIYTKAWVGADAESWLLALWLWLDAGLLCGKFAKCVHRLRAHTHARTNTHTLSHTFLTQLEHFLVLPKKCSAGNSCFTFTLIFLSRSCFLSLP